MTDELIKTRQSVAGGKEMEASADVVVLITSTDEEAHKIAKALLTQRKAACVNIVPRVSSFFWWQDKLDSAQESLLIVKTKTQLLNEIITLVKGIHSDEVPEIIALPIVGGNQDYLDWIGKEVK